MNKPSTQYSDLLEPVKAIAHQAGDAIMEIYDGLYCVEQKPDNSPVTEADYAAHNVIAAGLAQLTPDWPVLSEEGDAVDFAVRRQWRRYWLVDPLDGTREFIKCNGEFTVNIALIEKGRPVIGVVLAPAVNRLFAGCGKGLAFELPADDEKKALDRTAWRPIATSPAEPGSLRAVASRSHRDPETDAFLAKVKATSIVGAGSSLKFCLIACGDADVYPRFGRTMEWDTAAGQAVLEAAGGAVLTLEGEPLLYGKSEGGYANPPFVAWARRDMAIS